MLGFFRKLIFGLITVAVFILLVLVGFNVYINYQTYGFKREKENERLSKLKQQEDKEKLDRELAELQKNALEG
jgi:cell division protein FtsL